MLTLPDNDIIAPNTQANRSSDMPSAEFQEVLNILAERAAASADKTPTLAERREGIDKMGARFQDLSGVSLEPVNANGVPAEWAAAPGADPDKAILYLHGGGYVMGSIASHRGMAANLSRASGCRALVVDYRLAPEHHHPAQVEDAHAAYRWLLASGIDAASIAVAGDSAGGGLTVATMLAARDNGDPLPAAGVCISPWVDMEGLGESMTSKAGGIDPMVARDVLLEMAANFLGDADPRDPLAAPLHANLTGLPPLLIIVGTAETLLDDAARLHANAQAAGVDSAYEEWDDMVHIWPWFAPFLPEGRDAMARMGAFIKQRLGAAVPA